MYTDKELRRMHDSLDSALDVMLARMRKENSTETALAILDRVQRPIMHLIIDMRIKNGLDKEQMSRVITLTVSNIILAYSQAFTCTPDEMREQIVDMVGSILMSVAVAFDAAEELNRGHEDETIH